MRCPALMLSCGLMLTLLAAGCDTVAPIDESTLVVEGFIDSGRPLPDVLVRRTLTPNGTYHGERAAVSDADVTILLGGATVRYVPDPEREGTYRVEGTTAPMARAGQSFSFRASWQNTVAVATGKVPPRIDILDVSVQVPDAPVSAVLLDSLALTDSPSTGASTAYIYPVEVTVEWRDTTAAGWDLDESWIRAQLRPFAAFSSPVVDLFLRSEDIFREADRPSSAGRRTWAGIYAVGVAEADTPMPEHRLRISVVRSGAEYARFAATRDAPERREPVSNVRGGVGILAAVSVDSIHVHVGPRHHLP